MSTTSIKPDAGNTCEAMAAAVRSGDRRALARAITLVESTRADHRAEADALLEILQSDAGRSFRLGISGVPGVGKSTFIEALGLHLLDEHHSIAVLAVDPSSPRTGGSILGDKTRMEELSRQPGAFIRPSPSGGTLGGVARRTREVILLMEAAGFDIVIVETVGVGQSETAVAGLTDMFLLLLAPGAGDDLQGIKKGVVELADLIVVNKADGDLLPAAERARRDYGAALHLLRPTSETWQPKVMTCSALDKTGIDTVWTTVGDFRDVAETSGTLAARRAEQAVSWMWDEVTQSLLATVRGPGMNSAIARAEQAVTDGEQSPSSAAREILQAIRKA